MSTAAATVSRPRRSAGARAWALARHHSLTVFAVLALAYLLIPIGVIVLFSFNDPAGRFNYTWQGFTTEAWRAPFGVPGLGDAMAASLQIAALASIVATILGTLIALALVRYAFRGRGATPRLRKSASSEAPSTTSGVTIGTKMRKFVAPRPRNA